MDKAIAGRAVAGDLFQEEIGRPDEGVDLLLCQLLDLSINFLTLSARVTTEVADVPSE